MPAHDAFARYRNCKVCVTGGAGFIGSHLCDALNHHGAEVTVLDDLSAGRMKNLSSLSDRIHFIEGSILDNTDCTTAINGSSIIFHLAAMNSIPRSVEEPERFHQVNAMGTLTLLEAARKAGVKRFVYAGSSSAYGDQDQVIKTETMPPRPLSPYAAAKCAGEHLLRAYACCHGISGISLRYFNIFGPRQRADSPYAAVIPRFVETILKGKKPLIYGDGTQTRDFTPVANAVHANLLAGLCDQPLTGQVVNIACGGSVTVSDLLRRIAALLKVDPEYDSAPMRPGEVMHSQANINAARQVLGYEPVQDFNSGLAETVASLTPIR